MTIPQLEWLHLALVRGYEKGFTARPNRALKTLVRKRLIDRNPCSSGDHTEWRVTDKAVAEWEPGK